MTMEVRWQHGKTLEQISMEIVRVSMRMHANDKARVAAALAIPIEQLEKMIAQATSDDQIQKVAQKKYDQQREMARQRLTAPVPSHQSVQWKKDSEIEEDQGLMAVGTKEPRSESGITNRPPKAIKKSATSVTVGKSKSEAKRLAVQKE